MFDRVVVFGCSHAFGSEIQGPGIITSRKNIELSFGSQVAHHFNKPVKISARPGGSNRQMFINSVEHVQPGDLCILTWTYFSRENWFARSDHDLIESDVFNEYHISESAFLSDYPDQATNERLSSGGHQFIQDYNNPEVQSFVRAQRDYYQIASIQALNFLQIFSATNAVVKSIGGIPLNLHFDCDDSVLHLLTGDIDWPSRHMFKQDFYDNYASDDLLLNMGESDHIKLFSLYRENTDFIRFYDKKKKQTSFKKWICEKNNINGWGDDRRGHLGFSEHRELAQKIIQRLES